MAEATRDTYRFMVASELLAAYRDIQAELAWIETNHAGDWAYGGHSDAQRRLRLMTRELRRRGLLE